MINMPQYEVKKVDEKEKQIPRHIELGIQYGLLLPGYSFKDYIQEAIVKRNGYETVIVDGVQRAGKSNCSFQISAWAKEATLRIKRGDKWLFPGWDNPKPVDEVELYTAALKDLVFKTSDFVNTLEAIPEKQVLDSLWWDDLGAHFTNTAFKINPEEYSAVDSTFTVVGTACKVIISNIPNVTRLAKNVKDNASFEIFVGKNQMRMLKRVFRLPGIRRMDMNLFKVDVELPSKFDIFKVPTWAWDIYEDKRYKLAKEVLAVLKSVANMETLEGYIPVLDAIPICREAGVKWGIASIQQWVSRGVLAGQKVNGTLCVSRESLDKAIKAETS